MSLVTCRCSALCPCVTVFQEAWQVEPGSRTWKERNEWCHCRLSSESRKTPASRPCFQSLTSAKKQARCVKTAYSHLHLLISVHMHFAQCDLMDNSVIKCTHARTNTKFETTHRDTQKSMRIRTTANLLMKSNSRFHQKWTRSPMGKSYMCVSAREWEQRKVCVCESVRRRRARVIHVLCWP